MTTFEYTQEEINEIRLRVDGKTPQQANNPKNWIRYDRIKKGTGETYRMVNSLI